MGTINFNKVIAYSMAVCKQRSISRCAEFVKKAFQAGGAKYVSGNGWSNQPWCQTNDFKLIGDFVPERNNPRNPISAETSKICNVNGMQFPKMADGTPYKQQTGDVCLIKHGTYGHICYAMSADINSWVSDYFQRPPGQQEGTGPYCYQGGIQRVQFWRHSSVLNGAPTITLSNADINEYKSRPTVKQTSNRASASNQNNKTPITPTEVNSMNEKQKSTTGVVLGYHIRQK